MAKRMLIDATHPEETRVVVINGNRLEEFDFETSTKKQIKGNIYLAKVTRVEPSLQAAFVEYGGNRHGFLAFSEIHPDYYRIPVDDRSEVGEAAPVFQPRREEARPRFEASAEEAAAAETPAESALTESAPVETGREEWTQGEPASAETASQASGDGLAVAAHYAPAEHASADTDQAAETLQDTLGSALGESEAEAASSFPIAGLEAADANREFEGEAEHHGRHAEQADFTVVEVGGEDPSSVETEDEDEDDEAPARRHYRNYKIQEVIKRRQILLIQVTKEERGNKGAALTTYLSLAGRYCVLMPNAGRGGGVSRKITSATDRRRLKELMEELEVPEGMGVIVRTAGSERSKAEIKRDYEYLLRLWDEIRELTLRSSAPAMIYEEGNLIKRAIRDLYARDIEEVLVEGEDGHRTAKDFMRMLMPGQGGRVRAYRDRSIPLFHRFQVDSQIDQIHNPVVQLRSGGYIVINPTEALVSIDVNSGRATKERNIEETATKTNLEAAEEIARQLRLRDLAGLVVIDFIDMEDGRNQSAVERKLKEAMKNDRARIQLGRISPFGLLELSRQRLRSSLIEASTQVCPHCNGTGTIRSTESTALVVLRALEEEGIRRRTAEVALFVPTGIALYVLNQKRQALIDIEQRYGFSVVLQQDDSLVPPAHRLERVRAFTPQELAELPALAAAPVYEEDEEEDEIEEFGEESAETAETVEAEGEAASEEDRLQRRRRRRRRRRGGEDRESGAAEGLSEDSEAEGEDAPEDSSEAGETEGAEETTGAGIEDMAGEAEGARSDEESESDRKRRRRGKRGGRRRRREGQGEGEGPSEGFQAEGTDQGEADDYGYPPVLDFARDGREHIFGQDDEPANRTEGHRPTDSGQAASAIDTTISGGVTGTTGDGLEANLSPPTEPEATSNVVNIPIVDTGAEAPQVETSADDSIAGIAPESASEPEAEEKPKRRRAPRRKTEKTAEAAVPAADVPVVTVDPIAEAVAEKPKRRRAPRKSATIAAEATPSPEAAPDAVASTEAPAEPAPIEPAGEVAPVEVSVAPTGEPTSAVAADETPAPAPEASTAQVSSTGVQAEPEATPSPVEPAAPAKRGWWRRSP